VLSKLLYSDCINRPPTSLWLLGVCCIADTNDPIAFPNGPVGADVNELAMTLSNKTNRGYVRSVCHKCDFQSDIRPSKVTDFMNIVTSRFINSDVNNTQHILSDTLRAMLDYKTNRECPVCMDTGEVQWLYKKTTFVSLPDLLTLGLIDDHLVLDSELRLGQANMVKTLKLRGVIYYGQNHFTARVIDHAGVVWYHDGMETASVCRLKGYLKDHTNNTFLQLHCHKRAVCAVYASSFVPWY
jgi:hypothetical protein